MSAVIPVHNGARFISECVRSVLAQTIPVDQCIVVDDGSADSTLEVLRHSDFHDCLTIVHQRRLGVAAARNAGIREATGDLIAFLDADDLWLPHKLERQLAVMCDQPDASLHSDYTIANESLCPRRTVRIVRGGRRPPVDRALLLEGPGLAFSSTGLTARRLAEQAGGFDERLSTSADLDFAWRLSRLAPLLAVKETLTIRRHHCHGQMHRDVNRLERDMHATLDHAEAAGLPRPIAAVARTNLTTYLALRRFVDRPSATRLWGVVRTGAVHPGPMAAMVARGTAQRVAQRNAARATLVAGPTAALTAADHLPPGDRAIAAR